MDTQLDVKPDPAYLKLQGALRFPPPTANWPSHANLQVIAMQKSRVQYFRWTPKNARITFMYVAVIPTIMGYIAYNTDGLWDLRAKRKGDTAYEK
ncbi:hypothetical protein LLEC1_01123 [Akanthomyces lecanii]|uniref:Uncharacterized protein n=1 Tax=Cordyceps confragosa TaxID=2714763 RepID=A0A179I728_CORDF|nr:hypothetical protein LLEC1_01123 [Akanthomyces lecanii]